MVLARVHPGICDGGSEKHSVSMSRCRGTKLGVGLLLQSIVIIVITLLFLCYVYINMIVMITIITMNIIVFVIILITKFFLLL